LGLTGGSLYITGGSVLNDITANTLLINMISSDNTCYQKWRRYQIWISNNIRNLQII
jgi:hypothetical protein